MFWRVAVFSLWYRRSSALLSILAITISVCSLIAVEHIRHEAKNSFAQTVSGIDLIVGARGGEINLLLYSVFHLGSASRNMSYQNFEKLAQSPSVAWAVPLSMGDSHRGFRVIGTEPNFFHYYKFGQKQPLTFNSGQAFKNAHTIVIGAAVAKKLKYKIGDSITVSHGIAQQSFNHHEQHPFQVVGILNPTGTPVDQALYVSLMGLEAAHSATPSAMKPPQSITASLVGLTSRLKTFQVQRQINKSQPEPLMAILPGVTLTQLWESMNMMETILRGITGLILMAALTGLSATLLASMRERQKELIILRTLGARPWFVFTLIQAETLLITITACGLALGLYASILTTCQPWISSQFGLHISPNFVTGSIVNALLLILLVSACVSIFPNYRAYRMSRL